MAGSLVAAANAMPPIRLPSSAIRNSEFGRVSRAFSDADRMPVVGDFGDPLGAINGIVSRVPGLHQQVAHRRKIALACGANEHRYSIPSLALTSALTACGLALPPVAFITWPTNQPTSVGLALSLRDLVGVGGDDLVDGLLDGAGVGDLLHAAASRRSRRGSPPSLQTISNRSLAILPEIVPSSIRSMMPPSWPAMTGRLVDRPCRPCSAAPSRSLITQLAASLAVAARAPAASK